MKVDSPASARRSFNAAKSFSDMYTSPRTSTSGGTPSACSGIEPIVRRLCVTSSPTSPLPRVAPRSRIPLRYTRLIARPSIFGSTTNSNLGRSIPSRARWLRIRSTHARSSSSVRAFGSDSIGSRCVTFSSFPTGSAPTRWVGESGLANSGCSFSKPRSSSSSASYCSSPIVGSSST